MRFLPRVTVLVAAILSIPAPKGRQRVAPGVSPGLDGRRESSPKGATQRHVDKYVSPLQGSISCNFLPGAYAPGYSLTLLRSSVSDAKKVLRQKLPKGSRKS